MSDEEETLEDKYRAGKITREQFWTLIPEEKAEKEARLLKAFLEWVKGATGVPKR